MRGRSASNVVRRSARAVRKRHCTRNSQPNRFNRFPGRSARARAFILIGAAFCACGAEAFTVERSAAHFADRRYHCELTVVLDAPIDRVERVLRDYEAYPELDERILDARVLDRPQENVAVLATTVRVCLGWFCRNVERIEQVVEAPHALASTVDPARSDVAFGESQTTLEPVEKSTRVTYQTSVRPGFWVPAIFGRRWMLSVLEDATMDLFRNVEKKAKQADGG